MFIRMFVLEYIVRFTCIAQLKQNGTCIAVVSLLLPLPLCFLTSDYGHLRSCCCRAGYTEEVKLNPSMLEKRKPCFLQNWGRRLGGLLKSFSDAPLCNSLQTSAQAWDTPLYEENPTPPFPFLFSKFMFPDANSCHLDKARFSHSVLP